MIGAILSGLSLKTKLISAAAIVVISVGIYTSGYVVGYQKGKAKSEILLARTAEQIANANAKIEKIRSQINEKIFIKYVEKEKVITKNKYIYLDIIDKDVPKQHELSNGWVNTHDAIVADIVPAKDQSSDPKPSGVFDNEALKVVADNYQNCKLDKAKLDSLQEWVVENEKASKEFEVKVNE